MKTINVYSFDELSEKAQKKAIETWRNEPDDYNYGDDLKMEAEELLKKHRIKAENFKVGYSLEYSQGDGVNLTGDFKFKGCTFRNYHTWIYSFPESTDITLIDGATKDATITKREEEFKAVYVSICKELEKFGYELIEDNNSDESISETLRANEYDFLEDGRRI